MGEREFGDCHGRAIIAQVLAGEPQRIVLHLHWQKDMEAREILGPVADPDIEILKLVLGPAETNCFILGNRATQEAAVIDPSWSGQHIAQEIENRRWKLTHVLITHAHMDHIGGCRALTRQLPAPVALHREDLPLYHAGGGAKTFGFSIEPGPPPSIWLQQGMMLKTAGLSFEVLHLPGHTAGHVGFYDRSRGWLFQGDVLFQGGIGRTDLPGQDYAALMVSIRDHLLPLPDETRVFTGHGPDTTIGIERGTNPFLVGLTLPP